MNKCVFCQSAGGEILFSCQLYRVVLIDDVDYPGYLRVVLNQHCKELSDLADEANLELYQAVIACEKILRRLFNPDKVNLASFGNLTPHVHWHIIARYVTDKHFPNPTWGEVTHSEYQPTERIRRAKSELRSQFEDLFLTEDLGCHN